MQTDQPRSEPAASFIPGANVGPYRIVEQAERNGLATTYTAYQPAQGHYVSVIALPNVQQDDVPLLRQRQRQLEIIASLRHPNILTLLDHGEHQGVSFIVTELIEAEPLSARLGAPWPLAEVVRVLRPIAAALDYAHEHGIVHGDIRPGMVLVTPDGTPILGGFGLTAHLPPPADDTPTLVPGQRNRSPIEEIAAGQERDRRGLALIAYEMLTGRAVDIEGVPTERALPPAQPGSPLLAPPVEQTLLRELAGEPSERYPTASAFVADLAATPTPRTGTEPASVPPPPNGAVVADPSRRRLAILGLVLATVLLLGLAVIFTREFANSRSAASRPTGSPSSETAAVPATSGAGTTGAGATGAATQAATKPGAAGTPGAGAAGAAGSSSAPGASGASTAAGASGVAAAAGTPGASASGAPAGAGTSTTGAAVPAAAGAAAASEPTSATTPGALPTRSGSSVVLVPSPILSTSTPATGSSTSGSTAPAPTAAGATGAAPTTPRPTSGRIPANWRVTGDSSGRWTLDEQGRLVGHVESGTSVLLFPEMVDNVEFSAQVNTTSCQAALVFRAQDADNLLMAIYIPDGLVTPGAASGGLWLYQKIDGTDLPIRAVRSAGIRQAGEPVRMRIATQGQQILVALNDDPAIQAIDTSAKSGRLGMLVYSADGRTCETTFSDILR